MTLDIDIVIRLKSDQVGDLCSVFPEQDFYVSRPAALDAVRHSGQFNVIHPASGNKIDFMVAGESDWAATQLGRRRQFHFNTETVGYVAAPEDVILGKLIYYRDGSSDKHLRDIRGILKTSGDELDRDYVVKHAETLGVADVWQELLKSVE